MKRLEIKGLSFAYANKKEKSVIFNNLNLVLQEGEFIVILGPSGCGKSTLLKVIAGLLNPESGRMYINGLDASLMKNKDKNIGYVSQSYTIYSFLSVYENIALPLKAQKIALDEIEERVEEAARYFGIEYLLSRKPRQLSEGQKQRVSLARAFIKHPSLYLLDEPFSGLDYQTKQDLRAFLKNLHRNENGTFLMVSHDLNDATALADRVLRMDEDGSLKEVRKEALFGEEGLAFQKILNQEKE